MRLLSVWGALVLFAMSAGCAAGDSSSEGFSPSPTDGGSDGHAGSGGDAGVADAKDAVADQQQADVISDGAGVDGDTSVSDGSGDDGGDGSADVEPGDGEADGDADQDACASNPEVCDGLDNNCNGAKDENDPGGGGVCSVPNKQGVCADGTWHCQNGALRCVQDVDATQEICDGLDNNCDGVVDNNPSDTGAACNTGLQGVCAAGTERCQNGQIACEQNVQQSTETCNGLDDDCNGTPDDGFPGAGQPCTVTGQNPNTPCAQGLTNCLGGQNGCTQTVFPTGEICDDKDNDCNGTIDDPAVVDNKTCDTGLPGECALGTTQCTSGQLTCVSTVHPGTLPETCNAKDDDCNGTVDDVVNIKLECATKFASAQNVSSWACTVGNCEVAGCSGASADCDSAPANGCEVNTLNDIAHCGQCGKLCSSAHGTPSCGFGVCQIACATSWGNCDGDLTNGCELPISADVDNCGACGNHCDSTSGTPTCTGGLCSIACNAGLGNCDGSVANGCEASLLTDPAHCGSCAKTCSSVGGTPLCAGGVCDIMCNLTTADCDNNLANGCESNLMADATHCGGCANVCNSTNGTASCTNGLCAITCAPGFGNCDGDVTNGCETNLATSAANCGACASPCSSVNGTPSCGGGQCAIVCNAGYANCDGSAANGCEASTASDPAHCGSCSKVCTAPHGTATCGNGLCGILCTAPWDDCDGDLANGCEINTATNTGNCGGCGVACSSTNGTATCSAGQCGIACSSGWGNCDAQVFNGCETNLNTAPSHCGACTTVCSAIHGTATCSNGACGITCAPSWGDCDGDASNGCEADLRNEAQHCGACTTQCSSSGGAPNCNNGVCGIACTAPYGDCDGIAANGCETNQSSSTSNCGGCGLACSTNHATPTCTSGACQLSCAAGYANCDSDLGNGCESSLLTDASHCGSCAKVCDATWGTPSCTSGACTIACAVGHGNCDGTADNGCEANLKTDPLNCNACGTVCNSSNGTATCSNGACGITCTAPYADCDGNAANGCEANTAASIGNCGGCGTVCSLPNATATCTSGTCAISFCNAGYANCDGDTANGCETNLNASPLHCGTCTKVCSSAGGTPACTNGICSIACGPTAADCDNNVDNGCEVSLLTNPLSCGGCGNACSAENGTPYCSSGLCGITCNAGFANCDGNAMNGCEVNLSSNTAHCGSCPNACSTAGGTASCTGGVCGITCDATTANCDGNLANGCEVNLLNDTAHCGGCTNVCSSANGTPSCSGGSCSIACGAGYGNCDGNVLNGCETNLKTSAANCNACGNTCSSDHGSASCLAGACQISCAAGWGNCDGDVSNGCEKDLQTSTQNCGACNAPCSSVNGTPSCNAGSCSISCNAGYGDCDGSANNGCEVNLLTDTSHCGSCPAACSSANGAPSCTGGTCGITCSAGYGNCDGNAANGCETNLGTSATNCNGCGNVCNGTHGTPSCGGGSCQITCDTDWANCDGTTSNGCETNIKTSTTSCGGCGLACSTINGTASCTNGTCDIACTAGWGNCDGNVANGCETNLKTDEAHCGSCAGVCSTVHGSPTCSNGACTIACTSPWDNCDGNVANGCEIDKSSSVANCGGCGSACNSTHGTASCTAGACGIACAAGYGNCDGQASNGCEVDLTIDPTHCNTCSTVCSTAHGTASCASGACGIGCDANWGNCDGLVSNGCEADFKNDASHCGGCTTACSSSGGTPSCNNGICGISCSTGAGDCDGNTGNGCETNTTNNALHCGGCGLACSTNHATPTCSSSVCSVSCLANYANCNGLVVDGCEVALQTDPVHCGSCSTVCNNTNGTPGCSSGACTISCAADYGNCDGNVSNGCESNLKTDVSNCNACGTVCNSTNGAATCATGVCGINCTAPYANCDGNLSNGCEINTSTNVSNCGGCGAACNLAHATAACTTGSCTIASCASGYANCDAVPSNGCEISTTNDATHCGSCSKVCSSVNGVPSCASSACQIACNTGFADCDGNADTGCEVNKNNDPNNCNACGTKCNGTNGTPSCSGGACLISCNSGYGNCDGNVSNGCEINTNTNALHCGGCGNACNLPNATSACSAGGCVIASCNPGFANCNGIASDGCEVNLNADPTHCGSCVKVCSTTNGTASCSAGACQITCNAGFADCDGNVDNGCEVNKNTDVNNCNACGAACSAANGAPSCNNGVCQIACTSGFGNCDGNVANGCETNTNTSVGNCGGCSNACNATNGTPSCNAGQCQIACASGYANCDGSASNGCEINTTNDVNNCGACTAPCSQSQPNVTARQCVSSACVVTGCASSYYDQDGQFSSGCECQEDTISNSCLTALDLGTVALDGSTSQTKNLTPTSSDTDWYKITFNTGPGCAFNPKVSISGDPNARIRVYTACGGGTPSGGQTCSAAETGLSNKDSLQVWEFTYSAPCCEACSIDPTPATTFPFVSIPSTVWVQVYTTADPTSCATYTLTFSN